MMYEDEIEKSMLTFILLLENVKEIIPLSRRQMKLSCYPLIGLRIDQCLAIVVGRISLFLRFLLVLCNLC